MPNPGLALPGRFNFNCQYVAAPGAWPSSFVVQKPDGAEMIVAGGLSKREWAAVMIAAELAQAYRGDAVLVAPPVATTAGLAVELADAVLSAARETPSDADSAAQ